MLLAFGIRSYIIKEFNPKSIGFTVDATVNYVIQYRQEYFHIFFIPLFGTGKKWIKVVDRGNQFELSKSEINVIKQKNIDIKPRWYHFLLKFSWFVLFLIIGIGVLSLEIFQKYVYLKADKQEQQETFLKLSQPKVQDLYNLYDGNGNYFTLKIEEIKNDSILFQVPTDIKVNYYCDASYFEDTKNKTKKVWIAKNQIQKTFIDKFDYEKKQDGILIPEFDFIFKDKIKLNTIRREKP